MTRAPAIGALVLALALGGGLAATGDRSSTAETASETAPESEAGLFTCPMHPHYISSDPDGTCPICGMDLVAAFGGAAGAVGDGSIAVAPEMIQTMGVRTAAAAIRSFGRRMRAFGTVETDERLETVSVSRLEGWIEDLTVRAEGESVEPGALLYRIYSPDLIAAQKDYLNALEIGNRRRIDAVRQRLRSLGMQPAAIVRLTETLQAVERVPVYAEAGGTVIELRIREGDYVKPGTPTLRLQSYADVWVIASVPERQLPLIRVGMAVHLTFPSAPEESGDERIDYVYPTIDPRTRTAEVRIVVDNESGALRPGAYADIGFDLGGEPRLSVPTEAVLRDSRGAHVIVSRSDGRFAGRAVRTGVSTGDWTEILAGLVPGERVVASGQFMLDSEANLREGLNKLRAFAGGPDTPLSELPIDAATLAQLDHFVDMALYFHEALVDRYRIDPFFVDPALAIGNALKARFADTKLVPIVEAGQAALRAAKTARGGDALAAELERLMTALEPWLLEGAPIHYRDAGLAFWRENETGRPWLQQGGAPRNPYGGGEAEIVPWPDPMAGMETDTAAAAPPPRGAVDPHAGHR